MVLLEEGNSTVKKKLLFVYQGQFGYSTDSYKYCQYLKEEFDITYICFDENKEKISEDGVKVFYILDASLGLQGDINFIRHCRQYINRNKFDLIFIGYFRLAPLLKIFFPFNKLILDIRSGTINDNVRKRKRTDTLRLIVSLFFQNITIISECLRKRLKIKAKKCHILPLGADELSIADKSFESMKLLYVGVLDYRNICETISGLSHFMKKLGKVEFKITYDIFGYGTTDEESLIKKIILENNLGSIVKFHGRKTHEELKPYFDSCNIGISYIPLKDYYQCQPPTKTFEYIMSGLLCIATSTYENKKLITEDNGILCIDNSESFSDALMNVYINRNKFDSKKIRKTLLDYKWETIVKHNLLNYLKSR